MIFIILQSAGRVHDVRAIKRRKRTSEPASTCRQSRTEGAALFGPGNHFWLDMYTIENSKVAQTSGTVIKNMLAHVVALRERL